MATERTELVEIERAVKACNAVAVPDPVRIALVRDLRPIAERLAEYSRVANTLDVLDKDDADSATICWAGIAADIKAVKDHQVLGAITAGLHDLHRKWTGLRDLFVDPMERDRKTIKGKVIAWQEAERKKAEEIQRGLQAEADEKARKEREALLKKAKSVKTPEKKEAYQEQAASVIAPTVHVEAPKSGLRTARAWKVKKIELGVFFKALAERHDLSGYVEVKTTRMESVKAGNPATEIPGVVFEQVVR